MNDLHDLAPLRAELAQWTTAGPTGLLPALQFAQSLYGHVPAAAAAEIGQALGVPLADVHGVIEFYALLYQRTGRAAPCVRVCTDPACALRGGEAVLAAACQQGGRRRGRDFG
jgi:NADH-quinone oxidoreductase subunit F